MRYKTRYKLEQSKFLHPLEYYALLDRCLLRYGVDTGIVDLFPLVVEGNGILLKDTSKDLHGAFGRLMFEDKVVVQVLRDHSALRVIEVNLRLINRVLHVLEL